jgi:hypothetical protein
MKLFLSNVYLLSLEFAIQKLQSSMLIGLASQVLDRVFLCYFTLLLFKFLISLFLLLLLLLSLFIFPFLVRLRFLLF